MRTGLPLVAVALTLFVTLSAAQPPGEDKVKKAKVPDAAAQEKAEKIIKLLFQKEYAKEDPAELLALSAELFKQGELSNDDPASRFVLFRESANLAARAGDFDAACRALGSLEKEFEVDGIDLRAAALSAAAPAAKTEAAHQDVAEAGLDLIDEAVAAGNFKAGQDVLKVVNAAAVKTKNPSLSGRAKVRGEE